MNVREGPMRYWVGDPEDHDFENFFWGALTKKEIFLPAWALSAIAIGFIAHEQNWLTNWYQDLGVFAAAALALPAFVGLGTYMWTAVHLDEDHLISHVHFATVPKAVYNGFAHVVNSIANRFNISKRV